MKYTIGVSSHVFQFWRVSHEFFFGKIELKTGWKSLRWERQGNKQEQRIKKKMFRLFMSPLQVLKIGPNFGEGLE